MNPGVAPGKRKDKTITNKTATPGPGIYFTVRKAQRAGASALAGVIQTRCGLLEFGSRTRARARNQLARGYMLVHKTIISGNRTGLSPDRFAPAIGNAPRRSDADVYRKARPQVAPPSGPGKPRATALRFCRVSPRPCVRHNFQDARHRNYHCRSFCSTPSRNRHDRTAH